MAGTIRLCQLELFRHRGEVRFFLWICHQWRFNTLRSRQDGRHFADDTFNRIFVNENVRIFINFSLKFVPKGPINNIPALVQIMVWRRPGDKPISEPVMVSLLTHICVFRPQLVNEKLGRVSSVKVWVDFFGAANFIEWPVVILKIISSTIWSTVLCDVWYMFFALTIPILLSISPFHSKILPTL